MLRQDLTPYSFRRDGVPLDGALNIGWLGNERDFNTGKMDSALRKKLDLAIKGSSLASFTTEPERGYHYCYLCPRQFQAPFFTADGKEFECGNATLWIPAVDCDRYYVSPTTIVHFIDDHDYLPPKEYLDALRNLSLDRSFNADVVLKMKLAATS